MTNDSRSGGFIQPINMASPEDLALDEILQALIVGVTGMPGNKVRPRWQIIPPPEPEVGTDWAAIGVTDSQPEANFGRVAIIHSATGGPVDGMDTSYENDDVNVLASFYGPNAESFANKLTSGLAIPQNRETLTFTGLSLATTNAKGLVVPDIVNGRTQRRVDVALSFRQVMTLQWPIANILTGVGTIASGSGTPQPFSSANPPFPD
jgi:hypothetical protein